MIDFSIADLIGGEPVPRATDADKVHAVAYHLMHVWFQFGGGFRNEAGLICLPYRGAKSCLDASDYLESLALGEGKDQHFETNEYGAALFGLTIEDEED